MYFTLQTKTVRQILIFTILTNTAPQLRSRCFSCSQAIPICVPGKKYCFIDTKIKSLLHKVFEGDSKPRGVGPKV